MKKARKLTSLILSVLMLIGLFSLGAVSVSADTSVMLSSGQYSYKLLNDDTAEITSCSPKDRDISIPSEIGGHIVSALGDNLFSSYSYQGGYYSVTVPEGIKNIGANAFNNSMLLSISLPESLTAIGAGAFKSCGSIKSINLPNSLTEISDNLFEGCYSLNAVTIPQSVTSIGNSAFKNTALENVVIPENVTTIGYNAFEKCSKLASVTLNEKLKTIYNEAFSECTNLNGITIPASVEFIGDHAFYYCQKLNHDNVELPETVELGFEVFKSTGYDPDVIISSDYRYKLENGKAVIVSYTGNAKKLTVPSKIDGKTVTKIGDWAFDGVDSLESVTVPSTVTRIGECAFQSCSKLSTIKLPDSVYSIGSWAFHLTSWEDDHNSGNVYIGKVLYAVHSSSYKCNVKKGTIGIADEAFSFYNNLDIAEVTFPDTVKHIGEKAFYNCYNLKTVVAPASIKSIGKDAFTVDYKVNQITFYGETGSSIYYFAINNGFKFSKMTAAQKAATDTTLGLNKTKASLKASGTVTLKVNNGKAKTWKSSNTKIAAVKNGKVTALKKGSATITVTTTDNKKLTCKVTVKTSPTLSRKSVTVNKGNTVKIKITGKASTVKNKYTKTKYAKITSKATANTIVVKGLKKGKTTLKITVNGVVLKLKVKVK